MQYHLISGLPRSGSTLLSAVLRQNPRFSAGISSPVHGLFEAVIAQCSTGSEMAPLISPAQRTALLRALFAAYHGETAGDPARPVVFDTNRRWTARLPALAQLFPEARVLCCVRELPWVMDSLERRFRADPFENTRLFASSDERSTVYTRLETLARDNRLVGSAYSALKEAFFSEFADRLLIIDYEVLTRRPREVIRLVYEFLGEPWFEHDFENVTYDAPAFDENLGVHGLHRVRPEIAPNERSTILPPDLFARFEGRSFWRDGRKSNANLIAPRPTSSNVSKTSLDL